MLFLILKRRNVFSFSLFVSFTFKQWLNSNKLNFSSANPYAMCVPIWTAILRTLVLCAPGADIHSTISVWQIYQIRKNHTDHEDQIQSA